MAKNPCGRCGALLFVAILVGCGSGTKTPTTTNVTLSNTSFDFGENLVGNPLQKTAVTVTNTGTIVLTLHPVLSGDASYSIVAAQSCGSQLAPQASCTVVVQYAPTVASAPAAQTATLNLYLNDATPGTPSAVSLTGVSAAMAPGTVTPTGNPQVALYTITPPFAGSVTVSFGTTTDYGLNTFSVPTPNGGGPVSIEVAGMRANTTYHLRASVAFQNGISANDTDHTFATGVLIPGWQSVLTATTSAGQTPQGGIEILNPVGVSGMIVATDLSGQIIWGYVPHEAPSHGALFAPKQLPNGDFIFLYSDASSAPIGAGFNPNDPDFVREIDLAGNTIKQITMAQLNARLAAANYNVTLQVFSHDVTPLPNGHWLVLANTIKSVVLNGQTTPTNVLGDVIVDLDTNLNPVWVWNEFDHLDVNRHPAFFTASTPDWTHTNAIVYSKDDGNLLVSIRHQSWVVKVDYNNGAGAGDILWRLGYQGDFQLMNNGVADNDPADWFYGQHGPAFTTTNTTGIFGLTLMDNGNFRIFPSGVTCGTAGAPPCYYSTIPVFQIDETAKTANLVFHQILPTSLYNMFGGNAQMLPNGNIEYDLCGLMPESAQIIEVTNQATPQTVWNLTAASNWVYRGYRLPSLYPGVQW